MAIELSEIEQEELAGYWRILSLYPSLHAEIKLRRQEVSGRLVVLTWIDGTDGHLDPVFEAELGMKTALQNVRAHLDLDPRIRGAQPEPRWAEQFEPYQPSPPIPA